MSAHTPGPWFWDADRTSLVGAKGAKVLQDGEGIWDLCSYAAIVDGKPKRAIADARLIATAPDMLKALRLLVRHIGVTDFAQDAEPFNTVRAVISQATGEAK